MQGSLDPKKEAEAALMLIDNAIKTHEQVSREMSGGDWEENVEQLQRENELLTQAGGNKVTVVSASPKEGDGDEDYPCSSPSALWQVSPSAHPLPNPPW